MSKKEKLQKSPFAASSPALTPEFYDGFGWFSLATQSYVNASTVTLSGAVMGSGNVGSTLTISLNSSQNPVSTFINFNWTNSGSFAEYHFDHYLQDSSTPPQFVSSVIAGTNRGWQLIFQPGFSSQPTGNFQIDFIHPTGGRQTPFRINTYGSTLRVYMGTVLDMQNNAIINCPNPLNNFDPTNKYYVDTHTWTSSQITDLSTTIANTSLSLTGVVTGSGTIGSALSTSFAGNPVFPGTASMTLPIGTTAQRPSSPLFGMMRANSTLTAIEIYNGSSWVSLDTSSSFVSSVACTGSTGLTVSGSPITSSGTFVLTLGTELQALSGLNTLGVLCRTAANTYVPRNIAVGTGLSITNPAGTAGNPTLSIGTIPIANLSGYPGTTTTFLRGDGTWTSPVLSSLSGSLSASQISGYPTSSNAFLRGDGTWILPYVNNLNINGNVSFSSYSLTTSGNISATTGTLIANNLSSYSSTAIVVTNALSIQDTGNYFPYNGSYGYLNGSGSVGTSSGSNPYSINCNNRIKASEFNATSSIKVKNIEASGEDIEKEALEIFTKIPLYKYTYKDKIKNGEGSSFGVIAESLKEIVPSYVTDDQSFIPNIFQECSVEKIPSDGANFLYRLSFKEPISEINGERIQLILEDIIADARIMNVSENSISIISERQLPSRCFIYGSYESCPSVSKNKLFEMGLVVLQNVLRRVENIEKGVY